MAALNKEELRDRLGPEAERLWERANGTARRPLKLVQPPESFDESFEFDHEIETAEPLLFILRRFLEQIALRLSSIYLVARELTLTITFSGSCEDGIGASPARTAARQNDSTNRLASARLDRVSPYQQIPTQARSYERTFKIPQPTNDIDLLFRMLQTHLENFKSDHPIVAVALRAEPIRPVSQQFGLFETALRNPHQLYETLARLTALVGNDRIGSPVLEETHRPDTFRMETFTWGIKDEPDRRSETAATEEKIDGQRPPLQQKPALRRFPPPARTSIFISDGKYLSAEGSDCRRDNASPARTCHHRISGKILDQVGPFLLSGNWWDEKAWARAEYDMQLENGELVRAHEGPSRTGTKQWALDGIYD